MRRAQPAIGLKAKGYHHFAWIVLGLGVLVAVAGSDAAPAGGDVPVPAARGDAPAAARTSASAELAVPPALTEPGTEPGESLPVDLAEDEQSAAISAESDEQIELRGHPPLPGTTATGPQQVRAAPPPQPSPAELDRLLAGSRARSGGVDQGDESRRRS